jgi:mono/diheme cytochrome c family protein
MRFLSVLGGLCLVLVVAVAVYVIGGWYDVAANKPHWDATLKLLDLVRERSIEVHSGGISAPRPDDPKLVEDGAQIFNEVCRTCHGAPGVPSAVFARGLYPAPANLVSNEFQQEFKSGEVFWVVKNGLKMTGMPAFDSTFEDGELWSVVAFLKRQPGMSPEAYKTLTEKKDTPQP